ncbi:flavodoxin [Amphritea balenae]|uniref:Flavodoxin n=1 Tax=Amphritea balenae TaxID=452629 RepID=A0A3P1SWK3_9GAMM|nr:flavodoxin [Amphritea balenae]RRD01561.1 flavodoxin [Amphritea balenae]GGK55887.1 flavodoxin [Amphritea balenae]
MVALIYGSTTGNTLDIAVKVAQMLGEENTELFDVKDVGLDIINAFDQLVFAIPTWDYGEVQEDWDEVWHEVDDIDFTGKVVAFIGLGDQLGYSEWFVDAMGMLHDKIVNRGAQVIGHWSIDGYDFEDSKALTEDGKAFIGLALDEDTQRDLTDSRLVEWCNQIKPSIGLLA